MFIRKRTGELQEFKIEKIQNAMFKAFQQTHSMEKFEQEKNSLDSVISTKEEKSTVSKLRFPGRSSPEMTEDPEL